MLSPLTFPAEAWHMISKSRFPEITSPSTGSPRVPVAAAGSGILRARIWPVGRGYTFGAGPPAVGGRLRPALGRVLPFLPPPVGQQIHQRKGVAELLGATAVGVPLTGWS